jgi:hypothetical protein
VFPSWRYNSGRLAGDSASVEIPENTYDLSWLGKSFLYNQFNVNYDELNLCDVYDLFIQHTNLSKYVSHQWCDLFSSTTAQLYATHRKRE